ncbi:MAG: hypothetical protein KDG51_09325 [Calditrichaeota bacterium]|nr:hypothetical protein [Calditrichota bacterium]
MLYLKQSTAVTIKLGPFLDEDDGKTAEGSLTLSQADFRLSKNGGDFAQKSESSPAAHDEIGFYDVALDATDTNTLGRLLIAVHESGALPVWKEYMVVPANVYDSLIGGSDLLDVNTSQIEGADPSDTIRDAVVDDATRIDASALNTASGTTIPAILDDTDLIDDATSGLAKIAADVAAVLVDTAEIGAAGSGLSAVPWNAAWDAEVQSEVQDAIEVNHLDHLLAADYDPDSKPGVATALLNELIESDAGVSRLTANALEQAPTGGSAPTAAEIADAVWDEALAEHDTEDSFGNVLNDLVDEDGGGVYQFNSNALENAPTGGAGATDWTSGEKEQIRYRLQIDGTQTAPAADAPLQMPVSADAVSQDETAADNLEAMLDGTRATLYLNQLNISGSGAEQAVKIIQNSSVPALYVQSNGHAAHLKSSGIGDALVLESPLAVGLHCIGGDSGMALSGTANADFYLENGTSSGIACNNLTVAVRTQVENAILNAVLSSHTTAGTVGERLGRIPNAAAGGSGGLPTVDASNFIAGIQGTLNRLDDLNDLSATEVNAEVAAQLLAKKLHLLVSAAASMTEEVAAGSIIDQLADNGTADFDRTTDSLQAIADNAGGSGLTAQEVRDAMKLAPTGAEPAAGSVDALLDTLDGKIGNPVALDGGAATVGGMLTKLADDAGGASFDAETDSQTAIAAGGALDDSLPELTAGEPPATPTIKQAIMLLYMALRNASSTIKTGENTGTRQIKNNAGTVIADADVSDDGTTFNQGKLGAP